jgi:hypothetical protein
MLMQRWEHYFVGNVNCGSPITNLPLEIHLFSISAISRALTMLDIGTVGISPPLNLIEPLFNSA